MKHKIPISIILTGFCFTSVIVISILLWNGGKKGTLSLETIHGDSSILNQIQVDVTSTGDDRFLLTQSITFGNEDRVITKLTERFHETIEEESFEFTMQMSTWTDALQREYEILKNSNKSGTFKINDNIPYISPILSYGFWRMNIGNEETSPYLRIWMPDNAIITVDAKDSTNNRFMYPSFSDSCDSVIIDNGMYLTYYNWELNQPFTTNEQGSFPITYEGVTGLFFIPLKDGVPIKEVRPIFYDNILTKHVTKLLEIEVGSEKESIVLKMNAVFNDSKIALAVSEGEDLVLYLYDIKKNTMLDKFVIGEWKQSKDTYIENVNLLSNENDLSIHILYQKQEGYLTQDLFVIDYEKEESPKVIFSGSAETNMSQLNQDICFMETFDFIYDQGRVYYLMGYPNTIWRSTQYFYIFALSEDGLDYIGKVATDFSEDQTIGRLTGDTKLEDAKNRNYTNLHFVFQ